MALVMYWSRLPEDRRELLEQHLASGDYVAIITLLNHYRVGMDYLQLCCDIPDVAEAVAAYLDQSPPHE